jgi:hypothetical protein
MRPPHRALQSALNFPDFGSGGEQLSDDRRVWSVCNPALLFSFP